MNFLKNLVKLEIKFQHKNYYFYKITKIKKCRLLCWQKQNQRGQIADVNRTNLHRKP